MCPSLEINKKESDGCKNINSSIGNVPEVNSNLNCSNDVLLQTLRVTIRNGRRSKEVRALLDSGSQKSYVLESTARQLGLEAYGEVRLCHLLFGGVKEEQLHNTYQIEMSEGAKGAIIKFEVIGHDKICSRVPRMPKGSWMTELKEKGIFVNDLGPNESEIELLISSDYYAQWITGNKHCLQNGLVAWETLFGWTVSGKVEGCPEDRFDPNIAMQVCSMFMAEAGISQLWDLEVIAINDRADRKTKLE